MRQRIPIETHIQRGTFRADRHGGRTQAVLPPLPVEPPVTPDGLGEAGRAAWERVWEAGRSWLMPDIDGVLVENACALVDEIAGHREDLRRLGRMQTEPIVTRSGKEIGRRLRPNPALRSLRGAQDSLRRDLSELGFTPTARAALGLTVAKAESRLEAMIQRRHES